MSEEREVATLSLGSQLQLWTQVAMTLAGVWRERRLAGGRLAWSDDEDTAREHDHQVQAAAPTVRTVNDEERRILDSMPVDHMPVDGRRAQARDGSAVEIRVDRVADRWVLRGRATGTDGALAEVAVSCADGQQTDLLADELLGSGVQRMTQLAEFGELTAVRGRDAAAGLAEPTEQRLARTAEAVRSRWAPALAERVVDSEAFGALAWRMHEFEDRGHSMASVLDQIDTAKLSHTDVRDPAALAEYFADKLLDRLRSGEVDTTAVDGGVVTGPASPSGPAAAAVQRAPAPGSDRAAMRDKVAMGEIVRGALPARVAEKVMGCQTWPGVAKRLAQWQREGHSLPELFAAQSTERVFNARVPAAYLAKLLDTRINGMAAPAMPDVASRPTPSPRAPSRAGDGIPAVPRPGPAQPVRGHVDPAVLDPDSAVDRVGLEAHARAQDAVPGPPPAQHTAAAARVPPGRGRGDQSAAPAVRPGPRAVDIEPVRSAAAQPSPEMDAVERAAAACTPPGTLGRHPPRPYPASSTAAAAAPSPAASIDRSLRR